MTQTSLLAPAVGTEEIDAYFQARAELVSKVLAGFSRSIGDDAELRPLLAATAALDCTTMRRLVSQPLFHYWFYRLARLAQRRRFRPMADWLAHSTSRQCATVSSTCRSSATAY